MPATLALLKAYFDGAARQRAVSFWSIGSWGGSGLCSLIRRLGRFVVRLAVDFLDVDRCRCH